MENNKIELTAAERKLIEQYRSVNRQGQIYLEQQGDIVTKCGLYERGTITLPVWRQRIQ